MPTLRQKVSQFCVSAGTTNASSMRIAKLEDALKKSKDEMAEHKKDMKYQRAQTRKASKVSKPPKAPKAPKAPAAPKQEVKMAPLPPTQPTMGMTATPPASGGAHRGSKQTPKTEERKAELANIKELRDAYKSTNLAWRADPKNEEKAKAVREAHAAYMAAKKRGGTRRHRHTRNCRHSRRRAD